MGKADNALHEYWEDEEKFADLFNAILFGGKKVILPEQLTEADTRKNATVKKNIGKAREKAPLYSDLVKVAKIYKSDSRRPIPKYLSIVLISSSCEIAAILVLTELAISQLLILLSML